MSTWGGGDGVCRGATFSPPSVRYLCFVYRYDPSTSIIALVFPSTTTGWILQKSMPVHDNNKRWRPQCLCETTNLTLQSVQVSCKMLVQRSLYTVTTTLDQVPCEPQMALLPQCREYQLEWAQPHVVWPFNRCSRQSTCQFSLRLTPTHVVSIQACCWILTENVCLRKG